MIILKDGNSLYFGKASETIKFFEDKGKQMQLYFNPFEFILDTIQNFDIKANKGKSSFLLGFLFINILVIYNIY